MPGQVLSALVVVMTVLLLWVVREQVKARSQRERRRRRRARNGQYQRFWDRLVTRDRRKRIGCELPVRDAPEAAVRERLLAEPASPPR